MKKSEHAPIKPNHHACATKKEKDIETNQMIGQKHDYDQ